MTTIENHEPRDPMPSMTGRDRRILGVRVVLASAALTGPVLLIVAIIVFAMIRGQETRPWSHRSVSCIGAEALSVAAPA